MHSKFDHARRFRAGSHAAAWVACCLLFCLLQNGAVRADDQAQADAPEQEFLSELPLVLTPSRILQRLNEAPAAVTVIDRELIRASGYRDLGRLLRLVPGMQIGQERGNSQWVSYHGMGNDFPSWMQVLVDGRSVYSPGSFGGVDWPGLPVTLDEIERIEVVRGTNSVSYGANAFLGVVNIITRHSADTTDNKLSAGAGSADIRDANLELAGTAEQGSARLNAAVKHDDGFTGLHDGQTFKIASLRADTRIGDHDELMLRLAANSGTRELGYPDSIFGNNAERGSDSLNATLHVQWRHAPNPDEEWLLHYYRNQDRTSEEWTAFAPPAFYVPLDRNRSSVRDNLELQHRQTLSPTLRSLWGLELRADEIDSPFLYYGAAHQAAHLARLFGQLDWGFRPDWNLNASMLAEKFSGDAPHLSPRLFANWQVGPQDTLRAGFARAWLQPSLFERYGDVRAYYSGILLVQPFLPNPDLRAPRMDSLELGYLGQFQTWNTRLDVRLFNERVTDYITRVSHPEYLVPALAGTLPSARYENLAAPITLRGVEYQIDSRPRAGTRLLFSHSLIGRYSSDEAATRLTAPYTASLSWIQEWSGQWASTLTLLRMGPLAGGSGFVPLYQYTSRPYTTLDARLARTFRVGDVPLEVALTATNLGGRHQEIADRSEQSLHGTDPVNQTSPMAWLTFTLQPR
ncbi:MAG: TonB-dependent receptor [Sulfuricella sp.]|nr:TonB-dependent receptor [Sulfuricella sp.]